MIKFFRHIRQRLLTENKFSKYLLYAVGEIVLVVIGILIALQINNWNEERKATRKERQALVEVLSDLELNIASLDHALHTGPISADSCLYSIDILIKHFTQDGVDHDSLAQHFSKLFHYPEMDIKSSGYESLTSMGMDIITDDHLRSEIGRFYTYSIPAAQRSYDEIRDDFYNYMLFYMRNDFESRHVSGTNWIRIPREYNNLLSNGSFIESIKCFQGVLWYFKGKVTTTLKDCEQLKNKIDSKLKVS